MNIFDDTTVTVLRGGIPLAQNVPIQIDEQSPRENAYIQSDTYFGYLCIIENAARYGCTALLQGDLLIDENTNEQYRVKSRPRYFATLGHVELGADLHTGVAS